MRQERAVTIALFANLGLADSSVRRMVVDGIDLIVLLFRFADGRRRVVRISEPYWTPAATVAFNDLFVFEHEGYDGDGRVLGSFRQVGTSRFGERFRRMNLPLPDALVCGPAQPTT